MPISVARDPEHEEALIVWSGITSYPHLHLLMFLMAQGEMTPCEVMATPPISVTAGVARPTQRGTWCGRCGMQIRVDSAMLGVSVVEGGV